MKKRQILTLKQLLITLHALQGELVLQEEVLWELEKPEKR